MWKSLEACKETSSEDDVWLLPGLDWRVENVLFGDELVGWALHDVSEMSRTNQWEKVKLCDVM